MTDKASEARRIYFREWALRNKDHIKKYKREWNSNNPDKVRKHQERYWSKKAAEMEALSESAENE